MGQQFNRQQIEIDCLDQLIGQLMGKHSGKLKIIVKGDTIRAQIMEFLTINGYSYEASQMQYETYFEIELQAKASIGDSVLQKKPLIYDQALVITSEALGHSSDHYSQSVMRSVLLAWFEKDPLPNRVLFINSGVKLLNPESYILDALRRLHGQGIEIYASGSCLEHYGVLLPFDCVQRKTLFQLVSLMKTAKNTITL